jgi:hypothetical protein
MLLIGLWRRAAAGEHVATWRWVAAGGVGFLMVGLIRLSLLLTRSQRRYIEFRSDKIFLSQRGCVAIPRFIGWSVSPDLIEPRYTCLQLIYKFGFGLKRWEMLLDDEIQISELRQALATQIPQKQAT